MHPQVPDADDEESKDHQGEQVDGVGVVADEPIQQGK